MNTCKRSLRAKSSNVVKCGLCFVTLALIVGISPMITPVQQVQAAIDEAMPSTIPPEVIADWKDQGGTADEIKAKLPTEYQSKCDGTLNSACHWRRVARMKPYADMIDSLLFCRHHNFGGILVGYHDNSDAGTSDACWAAKGALCFLNLKNYYSTFTEILTKTDAVVRDPCVSFDGKKVLVAISGKSKGTGYKIYEIDISNVLKPGEPKAITTDPGVSGFTAADFEPCYMPNGDIMFTSTRNFGFVDCANNPTTNMFLMNGQGKYMRQIGFDQVNTFYPVVMEDGSVLYTRWEYNDRDITNTMGLFYMYPDGTHQTEWFGNQNGWPYSLLHGRPVPGTSNNKVFAVGGGHHGPYCGELCLIDRLKGTNGKQSITMVCPVRDTKPHVSKSDISQGNADFRWAYPYPLDDKNLLVSYRKSEMANGGSGSMGSSFDGKFNLYFMNIDGGRELLATGDQSMVQVVPCKATVKPPQVVVNANYKDSMAEFTMQNVYQGDGMKDKDGKQITSGAKTLRVIALHYRIQGTDGVAMTSGSAPSGMFAPAIFCPVAQYGGSWEAKEVLGEAPIFPDGSAAFKVPARVPVFFQVIDSNGYAMAAMRSWSTLMPGEKFACVGCHENKITSPPPTGSGQAGTAKPLTKPLGVENKPFDYTTMVQPIFEKNCVSCHKSGHSSGFDLSSGTAKNAGRNVPTSYTSLMKGIGAKSSNGALNICYMFEQPPQMPPYSFGSSQSAIMTKALNGTNTSMNKLSQNDKNIIACWIDLVCPSVGEYGTGASSIDKQLAILKKLKDIEKKNIADMLATDVKYNGKVVKAVLPAVEQFKVGYMPTKSSIVFKALSKGRLLVMDVRGKVIYSTKLLNGLTNGNVSVSLPAPLGMGVYFARFEGVKGIQQSKISIIK
jgi:hypothetical protein